MAVGAGTIPVQSPALSVECSLKSEGMCIWSMNEVCIAISARFKELLINIIITALLHGVLRVHGASFCPGASISFASFYASTSKLRYTKHFHFSLGFKWVLKNVQDLNLVLRSIVAYETRNLMLSVGMLYSQGFPDVSMSRDII